MPGQNRVLTGNTDPRIPDPGIGVCGEVITSLDGVTWEAAKPVVGLNGSWLNNAHGDLLIEGWHPNG